MSNVVKIEDRKKPAPINAVTLAEHDRREFVAFAAHGVTIDDVTEPGYWAHVAEKFQPFRTYIDVVAEDGSWYAKLFVIASERNWAKVDVVYHKSVGKKEVAKPESNYDVNFAPAQKWRVVRKSDKEVMAKDIDSKDDAYKWLKDYEERIK